MNLQVFNNALLLGWLLAIVGACLLNVGAGLVFGGLLLIAVTIAVARMGGIYKASPKTKDPD
jgi:hypothetical protein